MLSEQKGENETFRRQAASTDQTLHTSVDFVQDDRRHCTPAITARTLPLVDGPTLRGSE